MLIPGPIKRGITMKRFSKSMFSLMGIVLFLCIAGFHLWFSQLHITNMGIGMFLSLANALLLILTLLWGLIGITELFYLLKLHRQTKSLTQHESTSFKINLSIVIVYLVLFLCQLGYVIMYYEKIAV